MPRDWNDPASWSDYLGVRNKRTNATPGERLTGYGREQWHQAMRSPVYGWDPPVDHVTTPYFFVHRWAKIREFFLAIAPSDRIMVVGAGLGFLIEAAKDDGFPNVWGLETSTYIIGRSGVEARGDVVLIDEDIRAGIGGRVGSTLRQLTGDDAFDWVITEDILQDLTDAEIPTIDGACQLLTRETPDPPSRVIHLVIPLLPESRQDPEYNWHTLAEYRTLIPASNIVSTYGAWEVAA